jgi:hypothetical protein
VLGLGVVGAGFDGGVRELAMPPSLSRPRPGQ